MSFLNGLRKGWKNAKLFFIITGKHHKRCVELDKELMDYNLSKEDYNNFAFGKDTSVFGIGYSLAGLFFVLTHGRISRVATRNV